MIEFGRDKLIKLLPTFFYFILCTIILIFDFNIWIVGSTEYPRFYIMPIIFSIIFLILLILLLKLIKFKKDLDKLSSDVNYWNTLFLFIAYLAVIWFPRQFMIWKFGITFEKIPILYLTVTQIVLLEGLFLTEFGLKRELLLKNVLLGCVIALIDISIMTIFNLAIPIAVEGSYILSNIELFEISQFITFPWQLIAVGISEELFFRGYFFTKFRKAGKSFWHSAVVSSTVFMIFHLPWLISIDFTINLDLPYLIWRVVNTFPLGLICCTLYEKTNSLTAPIVYHGFYNSLSTFLLINSGPNYIIELLIGLIYFFVLSGIMFLAPWICKLLKFQHTFDLIRNDKISIIIEKKFNKKNLN